MKQICRICTINELSEASKPNGVCAICEDDPVGGLKIADAKIRANAADEKLRPAPLPPFEEIPVNEALLCQAARIASALERIANVFEDSVQKENGTIGVSSLIFNP